MVTKIQKKPAQQAAQATDRAPLSSSVKDSAQQIWQAGLGAFTRAQAEGSKAFESLVKEGVNIQRKTQTVAEERIAEATNKMSTMANDITSKATGQWDKLETIFEDRVAKALNKLGVPSAKDVNALIARIDELNLAVQKLSGKAPAPKAAAKSEPATTPKATTAKTATTATKKPAAKVTKKAAPKTKAPVAPKQP
jgi:poly(hydroxyalkanoate) granule-associated protein